MFFFKANIKTNASMACLAKNDVISNHLFDVFMQVNKLPSLIIQAERLEQCLEIHLDRPV